MNAAWQLISDGDRGCRHPAGGGKRIVCIAAVALLILFARGESRGSLIGFLGDGDPLANAAAQSIAMGGVSLALNRPELATYANPAQAASAPGPGIWMSLGQRSTSEETVREGAAAGEWEAEVTSDRVIYPLSGGIVWRPGREVGITLATVPDYDYRYEREVVVRDSLRPSLSIGRERLEGSGYLRHYGVAVGLRPVWWFAAGIGGGLARGQRTLETSTIYYGPAARDTTIRVDDKLEGRVYCAGIEVRAGRLLTLAAVYREGLDTGPIAYPPALGIGAAYGTRSGRGALFAADLIYRDPARAFRAHRLPEMVELRVGSEIRLRPDLSFMYGAALVPWYEDETVDRAVMSAGVERRFVGWRIAAAASVGTRNYISPDPHLTRDARVNESSMDVIVTISYGL
jgi:hypothetical protein